MGKKIAVIGDKGSVLGFQAVGFEAFETTGPEETKAALRQVTRGDYGIVFITEKAYSQVVDYADSFKELTIPAIIPIPGREGSMGLGMARVRKNVERAVGADILFKD